MILNGVVLDWYIFNIMIDGCGKVGKIVKVYFLFFEMKGCGYVFCVVIYNLVMDCVSKDGNLVCVGRLVDEMK